MTPTLRRTLIPLLVLALLASSLACGKKKKDVFSEESMLSIVEAADRTVRSALAADRCLKVYDWELPETLNPV